LQRAVEAPPLLRVRDNPVGADDVHHWHNSVEGARSPLPHRWSGPPNQNRPRSGHQDAGEWPAP